ncbi:MAG: RnfABCDGE type electron transport complex subunit D [Zetaproteobacteria bacterium]|nr:MAG: RnfABCDGE type electron transport complex subunit D [Zetaproteobacteria bacterium]
MSFIAVSSPHWHGGDSIRRIMWDVVVALVPAFLVAVWLYGWLAVLVVGASVATAIVSEAAFLKARGLPVAPRLADGSAVITGMLLGLMLPPTTVWWMVVAGAAFAIVVVKQSFGGLGYNLFNPAVSARVMLMVSFPAAMTQWAVPMPLGAAHDWYDFATAWRVFAHGLGALDRWDAVSTATPLGAVDLALREGRSALEALSNWQASAAFWGMEPGSLGETSAAAIVLGGIWLLWRNVITWHVPASYLLSLALCAAIAHALAPERFPGVAFHWLSGGVMLAAWFVATDPVTSPSTPSGRLVFGAGCGVLTWLIRSFGNYPEGAMFAVMIMNAATPLIDRYLRPRVYGR